MVAIAYRMKNVEIVEIEEMVYSSEKVEITTKKMEIKNVIKNNNGLKVE